MNTFSEFPLSPELQRVLEEKQFLKPTPIQQRVIPQILQSSQDLIAIAQTGTGKTAAFSLPVLSQMDTKSIQTVVLSPTRELAMQIGKDIQGFSKYVNNLKVAVVYGGSSIQDQIREIKRGAQVVVGTPGRMLDLIKRKVLKLNTVRWVVLDEADEMLNMGFVEDISSILSNTPEEKQTLLFSATMSKTIEGIGRKYMHDPLRIEMTGQQQTKLAISHQYMMVPARNKVAAFQRYRATHPDMYGIVFCRTKRETQEIGEALLKEGYPTGVLNGDIEQRHRTRIMETFKRKEITLLVATDVAARGIDVEKLTHVIHVGVPEQVESYVHRSGRTGRASESGISLVLAHLREHSALKRIERVKKITFEEIPLPKREDIIQADVERYIHLVEEKTDSSPLAKKYVDELLLNIPQEKMEEVARQVLLLSVGEIIKKHPEEEMDRPQVKGRHERRNSRNREGMKTLVVSLGKKNMLTVPHLFGMINEVTRGERVDVGHIQLGDRESSFEVPHDFVRKLCNKMSTLKYKGQGIRVKEGSPVRRSSRSRRPRDKRKTSRR